MTGTGDWYVPLAADTSARVIAFPHAGAGCAQFAGLARLLAPEYALWSANLPGRQARLSEPPLTDLTLLVDSLTSHLVPHTDRPYVLFGYCGGALLAFLVARALHAGGARQPLALVVASYPAPDIAPRPHGVATLPGSRLWDSLVEAGGMAPELAADERMRRIAEPAVRADFAVLADYRHQPAPPLPMAVYACHGLADPVPRGAMLGWRRQSEFPARVRGLPGGHWLLDSAAVPLSQVLREAFGDTGSAVPEGPA
ncbi:thioesterase II family protein [Actinoplanes utahensis]|uniref:thioesterase II family protein n=1 Tax=Actinoplanes utahensis TaxID=1869 RepID=UPI00068EED53|nr:thioesterase domain-containing protein [Actinoplanes utahensis]GIF28850.1 thioesterase [Actinoplanes utahensis]